VQYYYFSQLFMNITTVFGAGTAKSIAILTLITLITSLLPATIFAEEEAAPATPEAENVIITATTCADPTAINFEAEGDCEYVSQEATATSTEEAENDVVDPEIIEEPKAKQLASRIIEEEEPKPVVNTCLIPNSLGDTSEFVLNNSGEKTIGQMLADHGYSAIDTTADQMNYQVWNLTDMTAESVTFSMRVLGKRAGNTQIVGYYKAGDTLTFTEVLTQTLDTDGETSVSVTIPATFANSFGFALKSADKTWFSEISLNSDDEDHVAVYNPSQNLYLLAFEDFENLGDGDYNDIVIEISGVSCQKDNGDGGDGDEEVTVKRGGNGGGTRIKRAPAGEVLGASTSTPPGIVLGEATSTLPVGAPNTGAGGASQVVVTLPTIVAILPKAEKIK